MTKSLIDLNLFTIQAMCNAFDWDCEQIGVGRVPIVTIKQAIKPLPDDLDAKPGYKATSSIQTSQGNGCFNWSV